MYSFFRYILLILGHPGFRNIESVILKVGAGEFTIAAGGGASFILLLVVIHSLVIRRRVILPAPRRFGVSPAQFNLFSKLGYNLISAVDCQIA